MNSIQCFPNVVYLLLFCLSSLGRLLYIQHSNLPVRATVWPLPASGLGRDNQNRMWLFLLQVRNKHVPTAKLLKTGLNTRFTEHFEFACIFPYPR